MSNNENEKSERKAKMLALLKQLDTKGNVKNTLLETGKTLFVALAGAGTGAIVGKPSFVTGLGTIIIGHFIGSQRTTSFGVGMLACGGYQIGSSVGGTPVDGLEGAKERIKAFGTNLKERLYVDKLMKLKGKPKIDGTDGVGEVQYFKYPGNEIDMGSLEAIEREINQSSEQFEQRQMSGAEDDIMGVQDRIY